MSTAMASTGTGAEAGLEKLREALSLTERMLRYAEEGDWERVQWLESRRQFVLRNCFEEGAPIPSPEAVHALLHEIMAVDRKVADRVAAARNEAARVLQSVARGRRMAAAYGASEG